MRFRAETRAGSTQQIAMPDVGSVADPTIYGAILHVYNSTGQTADRVAIPLPAAGWQVAGVPGTPVEYVFSAPPGAPITRITLRSKVITISGGGPLFGFSLNEPAQGGVAVKLVLGDDTGWCADARPRPSGRNDAVDYFAAQSTSRPPVVCPPRP